MGAAASVRLGGVGGEEREELRRWRREVQKETSRCVCLFGGGCVGSVDCGWSDVYIIDYMYYVSVCVYRYGLFGGGGGGGGGDVAGRLLVWWG